MKKDKIFKQIKQDIISGHYKEGDKLPTEFECTDIYGVSRDTVRNAFKMLEKEGFIKRVKSKGTFVRLPDDDNSNKTVYFLVPCYEYLRFSTETFQQLMFELIAECAHAGWSLMPVIFSKTNKNTDIWWENLERFNSDSKIIVYHSWFSTYFQTLASIGAKTAFIRNDSNMPQEWIDYSAQWGHFIISDSYTGKDAVNHLHSCNCTKAALVMPSLNSPHNTLQKGFASACRSCSMQSCMLDIQHNDLTNIKKFYEQEKFDGLILHCSEYELMRHGSLHSALGIPADIPIVSIPLQNSNIFSDSHENIKIVKFPLKEIAHDIVKYLISPQKKKKSYTYYSEITPAEV